MGSRGRRGRRRRWVPGSDRGRQRRGERALLYIVILLVPQQQRVASPPECTEYTLILHPLLGGREYFCVQCWLCSCAQQHNHSKRGASIPSFN